MVASSHDGKTIEDWLTLPPGHVEGQRVPLILEIHGGPFAAYGPHFSTDNQLYAAAGSAVLSANPRGSTTYGAAFANEIDKAYTGKDYFDRSEERRVGKGCVSTGRFRWSGE